MKRTQLLLCFFMLSLTVTGVGAQESRQGDAEAGLAVRGSGKNPVKPAVQAPATPRLIRFAGTLKNHAGTPRTGVAGVTFALYAEQEGGARLWVETQNVALGERGRYTALLGITSDDGLPLELFTSAEARWLGIQVQGEPEQPRVLLVSVPYALKAADAERLGGRPATAFVLTESSEGEIPIDNPAAQIGGSGTTGFVPKFTSSTVIGDSQVFDDGNTVAIGTGGPVPPVATANPSKLHINGNLQLFGQATHEIQVEGTASAGRFGQDASGVFVQFTGKAGSNTALRFIRGTTEVMRITDKVGIGTANPQAKLHVAGGMKVLGKLEVRSTLGRLSMFDVAGSGFPDGMALVIGHISSGFGGSGSVTVGGGDALFPHVSRGPMCATNGGRGNVTGFTDHDGTPSGPFASVPGGERNTAAGFASFAAGRRANAALVLGEFTLSAVNSFVWADNSVDADFASTESFEFLVRASGGVGINTNNPLDMLHVGGEARVANCVKNSAGAGIAGTCPSDARLKSGIEPFPPLLDEVAQLTPVHFYWRADEYPERGFGRERSYGLVAQEVEKVLPELVKEDAQGFKAVNYSELPLVLLQAVKELKAENDALRSELDQQSADLTTIRWLLEQQAAELARLKAALERR